MMNLLYLFEAIRTPILNMVGMGVTFFGSETFLLIVMGIVFWCVDKNLGYRLMFSYMIAGSVNNAMKIGFRVERPWVRDSSFEAVEEAKSGATGYSFPSGHSSTVGVLGTTFLVGTESRLLKVLSVVFMVLVPVSRMYLGVHTVYDVCVGLGLAIIITLVVNKVMAGTSVDPRQISPIMFAMLLFPVALVIFALAMYYNGLASYEDIADSIKSAGAFFGFIIGWYTERTKIDFNERCNRVWKHILKVLLGFACVFAIKTGLKEVFSLIGDEFWPGDLIRYFLMTFFAVGIYPIFIKKVFSARIYYRK